MIIVNFKTYKEASGKGAISLAHTICDVAGESGIEVISCPQEVDLREVVKVAGHPASPAKPWRSRVWAQHVDVEERGRATGWIPAEIAKEARAEGTLLNHSEHKLSVGQLGEAMSRCRDVGLKTLVFADSVEEARIVAKFNPDFIGYEPPELIASKTSSVAQSKAEVIESVVKAVPNIPILAGAGIKSREDVEVSIKRGAKGVVPSSSVVKAEDPKEVLEDLIQGFKPKHG